MKKKLLLCSAMAVLLFTACTGGSLTPEQHSTPTLDSLLADTALLGEEAIAPANEADGTTPSDIKPAKIKMANDLDYSAGFLEKLTYTGLAKNIELVDSFIILEQADSFVFPQLLPKSKWTNFVASKSGYLYSLDVARINYSTLDFNFELRKGRQTIDQIHGKADLSPSFLLGSENDEDPETGNSYLADEYYFEGNDCTFNIRIGEDEGVKKVRVVKQCKSGKHNIALDACPVLLEK